MLRLALFCSLTVATGLRIRPQVHASSAQRPRAAILTCSEDGPKRLTAAEVTQVTELVADDEWSGLSMELQQACSAVIKEQLKTLDATAEISKELDEKVKAQVAAMRGKDEYEARARPVLPSCSCAHLSRRRRPHRRQHCV